MRRSLRRRIGEMFAFFSSLRKPAEISQQTSPRTKAPNPKESTRWKDFLHQIYSLKSLSHNIIWITNLWGQSFDATRFRAAHVPECRFKVPTARIMICLPEKNVQALLGNTWSNKVGAAIPGFLSSLNAPRAGFPHQNDESAN